MSIKQRHYSAEFKEQAIAKAFGRAADQTIRTIATDLNMSRGTLATWMKAALREGVLYVPGSFCYIKRGERPTPDTEARLCFGVATPDQIREAIRRLGRAAHGSLPKAQRVRSTCGA